MSNQPQFAAMPVLDFVQATAANTNRDGTGTLATVCTAAGNGTKLDRIVIEAVGTTTVGVVRLYVYDGSNNRLWREVLVTAITPSTTVMAYRAEILLEHFVLPSGYSLKASTHNAETFNIFAHGGYM